MRRVCLMAIAVSLMAALLSACQLQQGRSVSSAQIVELENASYRVEELTASTWTASPMRNTDASSQTTAVLVRAIEKASGCKATDSHFSAASGAMTAQVSCRERAKN